MSTQTTSVLLVMTNCPDRASALRIAQALLEKSLVACVNVYPEMLSLYNWQGEQEQAPEVALHLKTRAELYPQLEQAIIALHPYQVPEIIAIPVVQGLPAYLDWVQAETGNNHYAYDKQ
ncbi:MAG: divalent-cation tolerance protein CutA [Undibacterium curvum]|jgi:periplasmic divalent cation tolerance protein|uniref:Divalent-cation tolerance protein CutA n=1 Tax=Undibacterium curvum TaxID=2762294 RepID=A0ABR7A1U1_9BURK|nr:divalent-cation tolerance protein CutA [Undibacterium curvum]MBC3930886.1 divalent-cation tolerance protein CutA [Undibacterium curvum]